MTLHVPGDNGKPDTNLLQQISNLIPLASNHSVHSRVNTAKGRVAAFNRVQLQSKHEAMVSDLHKDGVQFAARLFATVKWEDCLSLTLNMKP